MIVYDTDHISSSAVCAPVAAGFGWQLNVAPWKRPVHGPAAFYGRDRGTLAVRRQCEADGVDWYMIDNGYMGARRYDGFYKITRNAFQCDGRDAPDEKRLASILDHTGMRVDDWRKPTKSGHILMCPPIKEYDDCHWFSTYLWLRRNSREIRKALGKAGKREIRVRYKPGDTRNVGERPLEQDFKNCHALVTHDSNIVVEAIAAGIPCFVTGKSPAQVLGNVDLWTIGDPRMDVDREEWLAILAANQWTLGEVRHGLANETLGIK